jgi:dienelactone hydrolase
MSQQNPWGQQPGVPNPYGGGGVAGQPPPWQQQPTPKKKQPNLLLWVLAILGGGTLLFVLVCCGLVAVMFSSPGASAAAQQPFDLAQIAMPPLPEPGPRRMFDPQVVVSETTILNQTGGIYTPAGHGGKLYVYLPAGEHPPHSLPCVLICGAGSTLIQGMNLAPLDGQGDSAEHLPYARAGIAVVAYELDGYSESHEFPTPSEYDAFRAACAGMVNARNALEFALAKVPEVNPKQIYTAGHSSAGTAALLFAAHEPRIAGCIAYAPCTDVVGWFPGIQVRMLSSEYQGLPDFLHRSSPLTHIERIKCPTLLFHAEDDSVVEIAQTRSFADKLTGQGTEVKLSTVPSGDHYDSMINQGIPGAIEWIKEKRGPD